MGEEYQVESGVKIAYSGLFKAKDLLKEIDGVMTKKGYDKIEKKSEEKVKAAGKYCLASMEYEKKPTNYVKYIVEVEVCMENLKQVAVTKGARKMKYDEADVKIEIKSKLKTDLAGRWKGRPWVVFAGHVINKYLYPIYTSNEIGDIRADTNHLKNSVKAFLNLYRF